MKIRWKRDKKNFKIYNTSLYVPLRSKTNHEELLSKLAVDGYINHKKGLFKTGQKLSKANKIIKLNTR